MYDDVNNPDLATGTAPTSKMVPGDEVTYTQVFTIKGDGQNLEGTIAYVEPALTSTFSPEVVYDVDVTSSSATVTETAPGSNQFEFSDPFGTATLTAVVTYELPSGTSGTTNQNKSATLPAASFTITQS